MISCRGLHQCLLQVPCLRLAGTSASTQSKISCVLALLLFLFGCLCSISGLCRSHGFWRRGIGNRLFCVVDDELASVGEDKQKNDDDNDALNSKLADESRVCNTGMSFNFTEESTIKRHAGMICCSFVEEALQRHAVALGCELSLKALQRYTAVIQGILVSGTVQCHAAMVEETLLLSASKRHTHSI